MISIDFQQSVFHISISIKEAKIGRMKNGWNSTCEVVSWQRWLRFINLFQSTEKKQETWWKITLGTMTRTNCIYLPKTVSLLLGVSEILYEEEYSAHNIYLIVSPEIKNIWWNYINEICRCRVKSIGMSSEIGGAAVTQFLFTSRHWWCMNCAMTHKFFKQKYYFVPISARSGCECVRAYTCILS